MNTAWHFPFMILVSLLVFWLMVRLILPQEEFRAKQAQIGLLALVVVVFGMLFGKYGATFGLPWWVYYPIPMLITVLLPPVVLKMNRQKTAAYLVLSFLSAPFIHVLFSFFLGWREYMPFWKIPALSSYLA
ncbi:hypothetical protein I2I05_02155 [Hymenobacter sp. BT683]|uniref:Uncharacterized protein n=1 Tax=Hymenobacter jeongseonensis TaxID=2791027 RepID=A0ABS0ICX4_9BACT|nr:hypothetical protein [Hymenobacter jeongseonensis]MBF9236188.1 hypothetical protein [Hymenobacter jeongseonensis]